MSGPETDRQPDFFQRMEEFGFLDHIYEQLPDDFTAVFEIARILEDPLHPMSCALGPVFALAGSGTRDRMEDEAPVGIPIIDDPEELEADRIRQPRDLPRMYHQQWLYPDEVLNVKLAKKELWAPYPVRPRYYPVDPDEDVYDPDGRKQKVYVLLDTSSSMRLHHRIHLAKAITFHFLRQNLKELGAISLRTFDTEVHPLHTAEDRESYHALVQYLMRLHTLGNGTALGKALLQAIDDIRRLPHLSGTEVLIITDGACVLQEDRIRDALGEDIVIHTVKIGGMQVYASRSLIHDRIFHEDTVQHRRIQELQDGVSSLEGQVRRAQSDALRRRLEKALAHARIEVQKQVDAMTEEIVVGYGHELERLSRLYLTVQDMDPRQVYHVDEERLASLEHEAERLRQRVEWMTTAEDLRRLAVLTDHVTFLLGQVESGSVRDRLRQVKEGLLALFRGGEEGGGMEPTTILRTLSPQDRHDLAFLLAKAGTGFRLGWLRRLLVWLFGRIQP